MVLRRFLAGLMGGNQPETFLLDLIETVVAEYTVVEHYVEEHGRLGPWHLFNATAEDRARVQPWLEEQRTRLLRRHSDGDRLALQWLADPAGLARQMEHLRQQMGKPNPYVINPLPLLGWWVLHHPAPGAAERLAEAVSSIYRETWQGRNLSHYEDGIMDRLFKALSAADGAQGFTATRALLAGGIALQANPGPSTSWPFDHFCMQVAEHLGVPLVNSGQATLADVEQILFLWPYIINHGRKFGDPGGWEQACREAVNRLLPRALGGEHNPQLGRILCAFQHYQSIDHFLTACRRLEQDPPSKPSAFDPETPLGWAIHLLRTIAPPAAGETARAAELASLSPKVRLLAALYSPRWAKLLEPHLDWPGLGALLPWLKRHSGAQPWNDSYQSENEEDEAGVLDRVTALEAVAAMGEERLARLLKNPFAKRLYQEGLFYLQAILGRNAADVEEGFLRRTKRSVIALALLPDEGDILQRYLAIRRFARESKQFGPTRQMREQLTAESALANLAVTAGYEDPSQLEWAMEGQLAQEATAQHTWQIGEYEVALASDEAATIQVERAGKRLKSVPPAVRQAPEYPEIQEAREQLKQQWDRVRRRLETAMILGEVMDRAAFFPALVTPAALAMLPALVLRCWPEGSAEPLELMNFATLGDEEVPVERLERFQVAHPLHLAESGTLSAWQLRLAEQKQVQPFPQLFRERYPVPPVDEYGRFTPPWLANRQVRNGPLAERLKRRGWRPDYEGQLSRRLPGRIEGCLAFSDGATYMEALEILTIHCIYLYVMGGHPGRRPEMSPLLFSEVQRDVDLASMAASPDRATLPPSPAVQSVRQELQAVLARVGKVDAGFPHPGVETERRTPQ